MTCTKVTFKPKSGMHTAAVRDDSRMALVAHPRQGSQPELYNYVEVSGGLQSPQLGGPDDSSSVGNAASAAIPIAHNIELNLPWRPKSEAPRSFS